MGSVETDAATAWFVFLCIVGAVSVVMSLRSMQRSLRDLVVLLEKIQAVIDKAKEDRL